MDSASDRGSGVDRETEDHRSETEKQRERERSEILGVGSEFLPFIMAFLGDDSIKIVALFFENRRPRSSWATIFEVVA